MQFRKSVPQILPVFLLLCVAGCGKFFVRQTTTTTGGGTGTGNYLYAANATTGTLTGFAVGTTGLSNTSNSPYSLGVAPSAMAVTFLRVAPFVYVASLSRSHLRVFRWQQTAP